MSEKGFTTKQVAEKTGLTFRAVWFYTDQGVIIPEIENPKGRGGIRRYSRENLIQVHIIKHLRESGFSLAVIKKVMGLLREQARGRRQKWWIDTIEGKDSLELAWCFVYDPGSDNPEVKYKTGLDVPLCRVGSDIPYSFSEYLGAKGRGIIVVINLSEITGRIVKGEPI